VYFEAARPQHGVIDHILAVRRADDEHVLVSSARAAAVAAAGVELVQAVDLAQQLVHHRVAVCAPPAAAVAAPAACAAAPAAVPAQGVDLVDNDHVHGRLLALPLPLLFGVLEQVPHALLTGNNSSGSKYSRECIIVIVLDNDEAASSSFLLLLRLLAD
jgi:hypothetical protein